MTEQVKTETFIVFTPRKRVIRIKHDGYNSGGQLARLFLKLFPNVTIEVPSLTVTLTCKEHSEYVRGLADSGGCRCAGASDDAKSIRHSRSNNGTNKGR